MIQNERQYEVTKTQLAKMRASLNEARAKLAARSDVPPVVRQGHLNGILALIGDMEAELAEYENLRAGKVPSLSLGSLDELPSTLVRARIARGWTHKELAQALGTTEQQVQKDENGGYARANLERLQRVASALGIEIAGRVRFGRAARQRRI